MAGVLNGHTRIISVRNRFSCLANRLVQTIEFRLGAENQLIKRLATLVDFGGGEDSRCLAAVGVDVVLGRRSLPGCRYLVDVRLCCLALRDQIDLLGMPRPRTSW